MDSKLEMYVLCELCNNKAEKVGFIISSDPVVAIDMCLVCWLEYSNSIEIRIVRDDEDVDEVAENLRIED